MLRSLYSGISGMKVNQTKLDVIGNNIANVGTTSFKSARVRFSDMLSQNISGAMAPGNTQGGVNPMQVGLGVSIAGIDTMVSQGMMQPTGRNLDFAVDGEGYFMVGKGELPDTNGTGVIIDGANTINNSNGMNVYYTRDGSFSRDSNGSLLTSDGYRVMGYSMNGSSQLPSLNYQGGFLQSVNRVDSDDQNLKVGNTLIPMVIPDKITYPKEAAKLFGSTKAIPITTAGNFDFKIDGTSHSINLNGDLASILASINTSLGVKETASYVNGKLNIKSASTGATSSIEIENTSNNNVLASLGLSTGSVLGSDEQEVRVRSFSAEKDGLIKAVMEDGNVVALGQVAMAAFNNPDGLVKMGKNIYQNSANSGEAVLRSGVGSLNDNGKGYGDVLQFALEMSNVDLAEQFTDMIVASRAFQANSKVITTGDEILQDILSIKR